MRRTSRVLQRTVQEPQGTGILQELPTKRLHDRVEDDSVKMMTMETLSVKCSMTLNHTSLIIRFIDLNLQQ